MPITGRFEADFTKFLDAVRSAEVALVDMDKGAAGVSKRLENLTVSFSGRRVIQEATLMATALEQAGGTSKLTASELERVGAKAAEAAEKLTRLGYDVPPGIQKLADETAHLREKNDDAGISVTKLVESYLTAQAIIGGLKAVFNALTGEISRSITAAADAEKAHNQLVAALKAQGTATPEVVSAFGDYATALQRSTIYQDDAIESAESLLVLVGNVMPRDMEKALKATTDLASGLGKDLNEAALLVAKAAEGNTNALKRSGIVIDETKAKAEGFGYVLDEIEKKFSGQAAALAGTYEGRLKQLGNTWNNVEESIGRVITQNATVLRAFELINGVIDQQTGELKDNATATNLVSEAVILTVRAFGSLAEGIDLVQTGGSGFMITIRNMAAALANLGITAISISRYLEPGVFKLGGGQQAIDALKNAVAELGARNESTTQRSIAFGNALQGVVARARDLAADLEKTKGKTVDLAKGTDTAKDAWERSTKSIDQTKEKTLEFATTIGLLDGEWNKAADGITIAGDHLSTVIPLFATLAKGLDPQMTDALDKARASMSAMGETFNEFHGGLTIAGDEMATITIPLFSKLPNVAAQATEQISKAGVAMQETFSDKLFNKLDDIDKILSHIPGKFAEIAAVAARTGKAVLKNLEQGDVFGALVSAAVGAIEVVGKLFHNAEKEINPVRQAFVDAAGGLDALNKHAHDAGTTLDQLLNAKNPEQYKAAIDALNKSFAAMDAHVKAVGDGIKKAVGGTNALADSLLSPLKDLQGQMDKAFSDFGKSSTSLAKLLLKKPGKDDAAAKEYGLDLASQIDGAMRAALGADTSFSDLGKKLAGAIADIQPSFEHLGQYVAATFAAQIHEGASAFEAFSALAPAFADLQAGIEEFGLKSTKTIDQLLKIQGVVGANKDIADSVQALSDIYDGLTESGYLTKDLFESFAEDISHQFDLLVSRGADGKTAMQLMQPELQKLWEGQQKFGDITDESTKKLLEQAEKQGLVGEDMKSVNDKILDVLVSIAKVFGADLPKSMQSMVEATKKANKDAQAELNKLHAPDLTVGIHFNVDQFPDVGDGFGKGAEPIRAAGGFEGRVTQPTLFLAGEAGPENVSIGQGGGGGHDSRLLQEIRDLLKGMPRMFRDGAMGAAV